MKAAMAAFIKKGLNRCTMDDVAREAEVGKGTSYLYFKSKEELMVVMYEHYALQSIELQKQFVAEAGDMSPRKLLEEICKELLADAIRHRPVFGLWFQFLALSSAPGLRNTVKKFWLRITAATALISKKSWSEECNWANSTGISINAR